MMIIGVPKEIKNHEYRVGMTPWGVKALTEAGHRVLVEAGAGEGSAISDEEYKQSKATLVTSPEKLFHEAELILKVKEPLTQEYTLLQKGQILFSFLHLAANRPLTASPKMSSQKANDTNRPTRDTMSNLSDRPGLANQSTASRMASQAAPTNNRPGSSAQKR